jgi:hypothetical protein
MSVLRYGLTFGAGYLVYREWKEQEIRRWSMHLDDRYDQKNHSQNTYRAMVDRLKTKQRLGKIQNMSQEEVESIRSLMYFLTAFPSSGLGCYHFFPFRYDVKPIFLPYVEVARCLVKHPYVQKELEQDTTLTREFKKVCLGLGVSIPINFASSISYSTV